MVLFLWQFHISLVIKNKKKWYELPFNFSYINNLRIMEIKNRSHFLVRRSLFAIEMQARTPIYTVFFIWTNLSSAIRSSRKIKANALAVWLEVCLFCVQNKCLWTKMAADLRIVELLLFASKKINFIIFFSEVDLVKDFFLDFHRWFGEDKLFCFSTFFHQMSTNIHRFNSSAFLVISVASWCQKCCLSSWLS